MRQAHQAHRIVSTKTLIQRAAILDAPFSLLLVLAAEAWGGEGAYFARLVYQDPRHRGLRMVGVDILRAEVNAKMIGDVGDLTASTYVSLWTMGHRGTAVMSCQRVDMIASVGFWVV